MGLRPHTLSQLERPPKWLRVYSPEHNKGRGSPGLWGCGKGLAVINIFPRDQIRNDNHLSFRKRLGLGEVGRRKKGVPRELETCTSLPLLQTCQEIWKVQKFVMRFPQRSQSDGRQSFSHLESRLCPGIKARVGSYPACLLWCELSQLLLGLFMLAARCGLRALRQERATFSQRL